MGSDIYYRSIGNNQYELTIKIYRDCSGANIGNLSVKASCEKGSIFLKPTLIEVKTISPLCDLLASPCENPLYMRIGIEEYTFKDTIDLNSSPFNKWSSQGCCQFKFSISTCCRNSRITTGISGTRFYTEYIMNTCNTNINYNSSPIPFNIPIVFVCCNKPIYLNMSMLDMDNDSLSYKLVSPQYMDNVDIIYRSPYTYKTPLYLYCPNGSRRNECTPKPEADIPEGFYLNEQNGDIVFTPIICNEVSIAAIEVKEWKKTSNGWVHVGTSIREMQLITQNCGDNSPPIILEPSSYTICEGDTICFDIEIEDDDSVSIKWNNGIEGATLIDGKFCWETKKGDGRSMVYSFTVTAEDNNCPYKGVSSKEFNIKVSPLPMAYRGYSNINCGGLVFEASSYDNLDYTWEIRDSLDNDSILFSSKEKQDTFKAEYSGNYIITLIIQNENGCSSIYKDNVYVSTYYTLTFNFKASTISGCVPITVDFKSYEEDSIYDLKYLWRFGDGQISTDNNPTIIFDVWGKYDVILTINTLDDKCSSTVQKVQYINVYPIPVADFVSDPSYFTILAKPEFKLINKSTIADDTLNYTWDFDLYNVSTLSENNKYSSEKNPLIKYNADTMSPCINLIVTSDYGCEDQITKCVVIGKDILVFIPTAFTPNNKGVNETFWIQSRGETDINLKIYNRWGEQLFESNNPISSEQGWDGTYRGKEAPQGVYVYLCELKGIDGKYYTFKGTITLLR